MHEHQTAAIPTVNPSLFNNPSGTHSPPTPHPAVMTDPPPRYLSVAGHRLLPLDISAKALFDHYVGRLDFLVADLGFSNNFIWFSRMSGFYQIIDDCFCLFSLNGDRLGMLLPPLGHCNDQLRALPTCFAIMDGFNAHPGDSTVEYASGELAQRLAADERWSLQPLHADYLYRSADLIELRGNAYKTKRGEINQFLRTYPDHRLEPLHQAHHDGIRELLNAWVQARIAQLQGAALGEFLTSVELERQGIERALRHFDALGLEGLCLIIGGRIEGFTFGERINPRVASILVEKTNFAIPGAAQFLFREFARRFADCEYINVGDDLGLENLRKVKMSYRPVLFGEKYSVARCPM